MFSLKREIQTSRIDWNLNGIHPNPGIGIVRKHPAHPTHRICSDISATRNVILALFLVVVILAWVPVCLCSLPNSVWNCHVKHGLAIVISLH